MPGQIALFDPTSGPPSPPWDSDNIRLRDELNREPSPQNTGFHVNPTSGLKYWAYVKVMNTGSDPIGSSGSPSPVQTPAATVSIKRVRLSTMPDQTDYTDMGNASSAIAPGQSLWIEFPLTQWVNPASSTPGAHYCLEAMGDASPDDPEPGWNNFNWNDPHFAQRNIVFA